MKVSQNSFDQSISEKLIRKAQKDATLVQYKLTNNNDSNNDI